MSLLTNINNVAFASNYGIDKIILDSGTTSFAVAAGTPASPTTYSGSVAHGLNKRNLVNATFSVDNVNFYPCGSDFYNGALVGGLPAFARCYVYSDATNIYIKDAVNCLNGSFVFYINYALESVL